MDKDSNCFLSLLSTVVTYGNACLSSHMVHARACSSAIHPAAITCRALQRARGKALPGRPNALEGGRWAVVRVCRRRQEG